MPIKNLNSITVGESNAIDAKEIAWNPDEGTFDMGLLNDVVLQAGQEMHFYGKAQGSISNGSAVMFTGAQGDHILMAEATQAAINANPEYFIGVATQDFVNNQFGYVTVFGKVRDIDTTIYRNGDSSSEGKILWFDSEGTVAGALTTVIPEAPNAKIRIAAVTRDHQTQGSILVKPMTEPKLTQLQDVETSNVSRNDLLVWNDVSDRWENGANTDDFATAAQGSLADSAVQPADLDNYVDLTSNQTIEGNKTFLDRVTVQGSWASTILDGDNIQLKKPNYPSGGWARNLLSFKEYDNSDIYNIGAYGGGNTYIYGYLGNSYNDTIARWYPNKDFSLQGRLGIGTTSPTAKLHVANGTLRTWAPVSGTSAIFESTVNNRNFVTLTAANEAEIWFGNAALQSKGRVRYEMVNDNMEFWTSSTQKMVIDGIGNVGIGTTSPVEKLDVDGNIKVHDSILIANSGNDDNFEISNSGPVGGSVLNLGNLVNIGDEFGGSNALTAFGNIVLSGSGNQEIKSDTGDFLMSFNSSSYDFRFANSTIIANPGFAKIYFSPLGSIIATVDGVNNRVGIGTTTPGHLLDVNGDINSSGSNKIGFNVNDDYSSGNIARYGMSRVGNVITLSGWDGVDISTRDNIRIKVANNGNVGIGNSAPSYKLDVTGDGRTTGNFRANSFITTSDSRKKRNIRDISSTRMSLRYKEFELIDDESGKKRYGILADDIAQDHPELVHYNENNEMGVDYTSLLVKKIAELEEQMSEAGGGSAKETISVHWRHYMSDKRMYTLYNTGATTAFPYAYGGIPVYKDMYLDNVMIANNPYSSRNRGPEGGNASVLVYVNNRLMGRRDNIKYDNEAFASVIADFGQSVRVPAGSVVHIRFQADGAWWYCNSTIILKEV